MYRIKFNASLTLRILVAVFFVALLILSNLARVVLAGSDTIIVDNFETVLVNNNINHEMDSYNTLTWREPRSNNRY